MRDDVDGDVLGIVHDDDVKHPIPKFELPSHNESMHEKHIRTRGSGGAATIGTKAFGWDKHPFSSKDEGRL